MTVVIAAVHESPIGTKRTFSDVGSSVAIGGKRTWRGQPNLVANDPGCVKTPTLNLRVEFPSRFRRCGNQLHW